MIKLVKLKTVKRLEAGNTACAQTSGLMSPLNHQDILIFHDVSYDNVTIEPPKIMGITHSPDTSLGTPV